ncbi:MAG: FG-GAP-like repeat-containing protein, partial [Limisphaerales bacterium]
GSLDTSFDPGSGAREDWVKNIRVLNDQRIMVVGWFRGFGNQPHNKVVRLHPNGSVDTSFAPVRFHDRSSVYALSVQADGKYLISGHFTNVNTFQHEGVARLNTDGSLDNTFNAQVGVNDFVETVQALENGKILVGGFFTSVNGQVRQRIARLNADGSLDTEFLPLPDQYLLSMTLESQRKVIIVGGFSLISGVPRSGVARLNLESPQPSLGNTAGYPRIFWQNESGLVAAWLFDEEGFAGNYTIPGRGPEWKVCGGADFDNDGQFDLLWYNSLNGRLEISLLENTNVLSTVYVRPGPAPDSGWRLFAITDLNQDSSPDLLWVRPDGRLIVWDMDGTSFVKARSLRDGAVINPNWRVRATADLNGDGKKDLIWQSVDGQVAVWFMNGNDFESSALIRNGSRYPEWRIIGAADFNRDGKSDLIWQRFDGKTAVWIMDGTEFVEAYFLRDGVSVAPAWRAIGAQ